MVALDFPHECVSLCVCLHVILASSAGPVWKSRWGWCHLWSETVSWTLLFIPYLTCHDGKHPLSTFHKAWAAAPAPSWPFGGISNLVLAELFVPRTVCFNKVKAFSCCHWEFLTCSQVCDEAKKILLLTSKNQRADELSASPPILWLSCCKWLSPHINYSLPNFSPNVINKISYTMARAVNTII